MAKPNDDPSDTGKLGYREPSEPRDLRPMISRPPFWRDESERLTYEHAVETNPRRAGEGAITYIARIAVLVEGRLAKIDKSMPRGTSQRQRDEQLRLLRDQAKALGVTTEAPGAPKDEI